MEHVGEIGLYSIYPILSAGNPVSHPNRAILKTTGHPRAKKRGAKPSAKGRARTSVVMDGEAEQIVNAIRGGGIDALVMKDARGEKVVTLHGAEDPYRVLVECVNDGAATLDS